ncbi:hypothetical protein CDL12_28163 [Handroanthus impetiginosus]|uniref:C2 NT-type domain-containing protein n=1 Tax=Handroanthus impetiginosus TaxID=429701 RepID=A0A2G9G1Z7_9LAMI|nr:hypothetical protein CDL12_28163 [Handroanthus impetiginosus]
MVQGPKNKTRKSPSVHLDYIIHIQEIKPWPPSQLLRKIRAVLIQWEHGDRSSGLTSQVVPSLGTGCDGRIEFNESFRLAVTLVRDISVKGGDGDTFLKNCIEFNLYEPRRDKTAKGQLLGTAVVDLAEFGVVKENVCLSAQINCKRTYWNTFQPLIFLRIEPVGRSRTSLSLRDSLMREALVDRNYCKEYADKAEAASFTTEDDILSHSSLVVTSSAVAESSGISLPHNEELEDKEEQKSNNKITENKTEAEKIQEDVVEGGRDMKTLPNSQEGMLASLFAKEKIANLSQQTDEHLNSVLNNENASSSSTEDPHVGQANDLIDHKTGEKHQECEKDRIMEEEEQHSEENLAINSISSSIDRPRHVKSVRSSVDSNRSNGPVRSNQSFLADAKNHAQVSVSSECEDAKMYMKETRNVLSDSGVLHLEHRMEILEGELREAAAIEVSVYSVVAEHGRSMSKVHAPARRLSRLTFWLSNSTVLRVIMSKSFEDSESPLAVETVTGTVHDGKKKTSPLKWEPFSRKSARGSIDESIGDLESPLTFVAALEKVEAWIFSRIIESIWWQTFTPYMQSDNAREIRSSMDSESSKLYRRTSSSIDEEQGSFSLELWKRAFMDACDRICPVRAGGHNCGCLAVLSRVIMEQLIARLDIAMFNAILRESADEIPTDPIADSISDAAVLPIPPGKASFGAGAQLKNTIGNWSRWLIDFLGINDDDLSEEDSLETAGEDERMSQDTSSKCFHLLSALSDLMMLPKDMLMSRTVRKEVCPTFGAPLIRRVLNCFIPDEFCPDPIPAVVLEALNSEDPFDPEDNSIMNFPVAAAPIVYHPPSAASVGSLLGETGSHLQLTRNKSSVLKKSQTSDDELEEFDSPLRSIILDASPSTGKPDWMSKENGSRNALRYELLREIWMDEV